MFVIIVKIIVISFFTNLLYELFHSVLYTTCLEMPVKKYVRLIFKASSVDAILIAGFYLITYVIFKNENPLMNNYQLGLFFIMSIAWAYLWEIYSIKHKRWEYSKNMPIVMGVGLTPLVQLFLTGILAFYITFAS